MEQNQTGASIIVDAIKGGEKAIGRLDEMALTAPIFPGHAFSPVVGEYLALSLIMGAKPLPPNIMQTTCADTIGKTTVIALKQAGRQLADWNSSPNLRSNQEFRLELTNNLLEGFIGKSQALLSHPNVEADNAKREMLVRAIQMF